MVKIVGQDTKKAKRVTCNSCGAILEYYEKDVKVAEYTCMGENSGCRYVDCPNCPGAGAARIPGTSW